MRRTLLCCALMLVSGSIADAADLERAREIVPAGPGPNRLEIDETLLRGAEPLDYAGSRFVSGLGDLRLSRDSSEVPYLLVSPPGIEERWVSGPILPLHATKKESGFELDLGTPRTVDALRLPDLPAPFLKRFRLEGSGDRAHWTLLEEEGTLFDLPAENLALREVGFAPGDFRYLRVTWDDRSSGRMRLPRSAEARIVTSASRVPVRFRVEIERRSSEPGKSRFHLTLPVEQIPARAIVLESAEKTLSRNGEVSEIRFAHGEAIPVQLGGALLRKVEREGVTATDLRIPIVEPEGPELELVIDDGDNPPFRLERAFVEIPSLPWIYFESESSDPLTARWGDPGIKAPRYDLEAKRESLVPSHVPKATWGAMFSPEPLEPSERFPEFEGASIDREIFTWMKPLPDSPPGLTSLLVDAEARAHSNDLRDLRIVTSDGRQIPYLVERRDEPLEVPLEVGERSEHDDGRSLYVVDLPWSTLPQGTRLVLRTEDRVFSRNVEIRTTGTDRSSRILASANWAHGNPSVEPRPLVVDPALHGKKRIEILIDEGDNAPLEISSATLLLPSVRLRFFRDRDAELSLMYGAGSLPAPRYDIDLLAPVLFGRRSHEIEPGPQQPLREIPSEREQTIWFWLIVAASAVVLFALIARLLR